MAFDIPEASLIACICEGGAETVIIDILLDNNLLIFNREQLIDESVIPRTSVKDFEYYYEGYIDRKDYKMELCILITKAWFKAYNYKKL